MSTLPYNALYNTFFVYDTHVTLLCNHIRLRLWRRHWPPVGHLTCCVQWWALLLHGLTGGWTLLDTHSTRRTQRRSCSVRMASVFLATTKPTTKPNNQPYK